MGLILLPGGMPGGKEYYERYIDFEGRNRHLVGGGGLIGDAAGTFGRQGIHGVHLG